jgi:GAF domain
MHWMSPLSGEGCVACRHDSPRVTAAEIAELGREVSAWQLLERDGIARLERAFDFPNFTEALAFTNRVGSPITEGVAIGALNIRRREVQPFTDEQVALLQTFADQAVIAIENVRLFNKTKEALEQQTATSEILRVISGSPTDVEPVFDTIVRAAVTLCNAEVGNVTRFDGELVHMAAIHADLAGRDRLRLMYPARPSGGLLACDPRRHSGPHPGPARTRGRGVPG